MFWLKDERRRWAAAGVFAAILFFALAFHRHPVGYYSDEARYILAAQSITHGHYVDLRTPDHPPLNYPPPGFPLFLSPFVKLAAPHWTVLKILPSILIVACAFLIAGAFMPLAGPTIATAAAVLFLLNPTTVDLSASILSEPLFSLSILIGLRVLAKKELRNTTDALLLGASAGFACWVRPEGALWLAAVLIALAVDRRRRFAWITAGLGLVFCGALASRAFFLQPHGAGPGGTWSAIVHYLAGQPGRFLAAYALKLFDLFVSKVTFGLLFQDHIPAVARAIILLAGLCLISLGVESFSKRFHTPAARRVLAGIVVFAPAYLLVHFCWLFLDARFFLPLLPFALLFILQGTADLGRRVFALSLALLAFIAVAGDVVLVLERRPETLPRETFAWMKANGDPRRVLAASASEVVHLYTDLPVKEARPPIEPEELRCRMIEAGAGGILYQALQQLGSHVSDEGDPGRSWQGSFEAMKKWHPGFRLIYENPPEGTALYALDARRQDVDACDAYKAAMMDIRAGRFAPAITSLDRALAADPDLTVAMNAYGASALLGGGNLDAAQTWLQKAIALRPSYDTARENLERIRRVHHRDRREPLKNHLLSY